MFGSIFRPYGKVWTILNNVTDVLGLSLLWCFCSLPLITFGAATTALYDAAVHGIRYGEEGTYRRFFRTFRHELKTGLGISLLWGGILLLGSYILAMLNDYASVNPQLTVFAGAYHVLILFPLGALCWSCMILSRFTHDFRSLTVVSVQFLVRHFFPSAAIAIMTWAAKWACAEYFVPILFLPASTVIGWSLFSEPIFTKLGAGLERKVKDE